MIITEKFVYIHNPKTGGTFVTEMLEETSRRYPEFIIENPARLKHAGVRKIPEEHTNKPIVINVRNPLEHYISRYEFKWWADKKHASNIFNLAKLQKIYPKFPDLTFREFLYMYNDWSLRKSHRLGKDGMPKIGANTWRLVGLTKHKPVRILKKLDRLNNRRLHREFTDITFLHTESLNQDLHDFLKPCLGGKLDLEFILKSGIILPRLGGRGETFSRHKYYDDETEDYVKHIDRLYFRLFEGFSD